MNSLKKMFWVIFRPNKIFKELKDRPVFVAPLILIVLSMLLFSYLSVFELQSLDKSTDKKISKSQDTGNKKVDENYIKVELRFLKEEGASTEELKVEEKILRGQKLEPEDKIAMWEYLKRDYGYSKSEIVEEIKYKEESITEDKKMAREEKKWEEEDKASQKETNKKIKKIKKNLPLYFGYQIFSTILSLLLSALSFFVVGIIIKRRKSYSHALSLVTVSYGPFIYGFAIVFLLLVFSINSSGSFLMGMLFVYPVVLTAVVMSFVVLVKGFAIIYETPHLKSLLIVLLVLAINLVVTYPLSFIFGI